MEVTLIINTPVFSINKMYYNKGNGKARTQEARNWSSLVFAELNRAYNQFQLKRFRKHFKSDSMGIEVSITAYYTKDKFFTQGGAISAKTIDVSNFEKPLIDLIYLPKYFTRTPPDGCNNLNVDDRFNLSVVSSKKPTNGDPYIIVKLNAVNLKERFEWELEESTEKSK